MADGPPFTASPSLNPTMGAPLLRVFLRRVGGYNPCLKIVTFLSDETYPALRCAKNGVPSGF